MEIELMKGISRASRIKRIALFVALGFVVTGVGKVVVRPALDAYLSVRDPVEAFRRFQWVMIGLGAGLVPFAAYLAWLAARILRSGQFSYPGAVVWHDTPIVRGRRALVRGWVIALCGVGLLGLAVYAATIRIYWLSIQVR